MKSALLILAIVLGPALALAASDAPPTNNPAAPLPIPPPGGVVVSPDGRIVISSSLCADLASTPPAPPDAEYKPGVDVEGQPVAPADLPAAAPLPLGPIEIGVDLRRRFGVTGQSRLMQHRPVAGLITVVGGVVYFDGAPLAVNERDAMIAACKAANR